MNDPVPETTRYIVGIDLGTTNCALAYVDAEAEALTLVDFPIHQYTGPDVQEPRDTLPAFLYALLPDEGTETDRRIHPAYRVGVHARDHGALTPGRLIASTKSWLCHSGVDRTAPLLPWHAPDDVTPLSPVQAQAVILNHIRTAWDEAHPDHPLSEQEVYITVPASFDEVARELTVEAARQAGIPALMLLEEPQAAFYAWLARHESEWTQRIAPNDHILVCDIGGGTTDLTLIHARPGQDGAVRFHRTAVGDHLILGGDNLDLALAHHLENKLGEGKLDARAWSILVRLCRHYKETLLADNAPEQIEVVLPGRGSGILRDRQQTTLTRSEVETLLLDGFFPRAEWDATPVRRASGFQEFGLPYASDHAITRYLAEFLRINLPRRADGTAAAPQAILLNGGLFEAAAMRQRLKDMLAVWFDSTRDETEPIQWLDHGRLDLAVARGAAYFGLVRRGRGVRVVSDLARSYYMGVESEIKTDTPEALCIAPAGLSADHPVHINRHPLRARLKTPVEFPLYVSSRRTTDRAGDRIPLDDESFTAMPPLRTVLTAGKQAAQSVVDVRLVSALTELGALDLRIEEIAGTRSWKLDFDLRAATRTDLSFHDGHGERGGVIEAALQENANTVLRDYFQRPVAQLRARSVVRELEQVLQRKRNEWPASVLRALWAELMERADIRRLSAEHEQRWLNMTGYCLRPGFGMALDDWRVSETWKISHAGPCSPSNEAVRAEWWILWRRIAGGLSTGQQAALAGPILSAFKTLFGGNPRARLAGREIRLADHETIELMRLTALLERLPRTQREMLGAWFTNRFIQERAPDAHRRAALWAVGRLGARVPLYGPINHLIPPETVSAWIETLCTAADDARELGFTLMSLARRTNDRYRDVDEATRARTVQRLEQSNARAHWIELVQNGGRLDAEEEAQAFGDQMPCGLMIA